MKRDWEVERRAVVRWLRWRAEADRADGNDHEARLTRDYAQSIEQGRHVMEGPPVQRRGKKAERAR